MDDISISDTSKDIKIIIIGDSETGKTSIIKRYIDNEFSEERITTISPEFSTKIIKSNDIIFRIQFWDIPGQDRNPALTSIFCRDSKGIIFCCDIERIETRENLREWYKSANNFNDIKNIPKIILENKCDLLNNENNYNNNIEPLKEISNELGCINCFRTSALNGYNINKSIDYLIDQCIKELEDVDIRSYKSFSIKKNIKKTKPEEKEASCC